MDPVQAFLQANTLAIQPFPPSSRYHAIPIATWTRADGVTAAYVRRRFVPRPEHFTLLEEHVVVGGDRLDNLAAHYVGDPQLYWRICDANRATRPDELIETAGRRLRITLPAGVAGASDAP